MTTTIAKEKKVNKITKTNYDQVCKRAHDLEKRLDKAYKSGKYPSLHYIRESWKFNMSDAAIQRHVRRVRENLGFDKAPRPNLVIPRKRSKVKS